MLGKIAVFPPVSKPWNKCDHFYENERITTIHSVFCSFSLSIFSGRAQYANYCRKNNRRKTFHL
ncbi:MAG: hypothetical protein MRZ29_02170 [Oscillospiraceae bacterium]|nr:hypothetical protein [Oscillospiraceae bacterium]